MGLSSGPGPSSWSATSRPSWRRASPASRPRTPAPRRSGATGRWATSRSGSPRRTRAARPRRGERERAAGAAVVPDSARAARRSGRVRRGGPRSRRPARDHRRGVRGGAYAAGTAGHTGDLAESRWAAAAVPLPRGRPARHRSGRAARHVRHRRPRGAARGARGPVRSGRHPRLRLRRERRHAGRGLPGRTDPDGYGEPDAAGADAERERGPDTRACGWRPTRWGRARQSTRR